MQLGEVRETTLPNTLREHANIVITHQPLLTFQFYRVGMNVAATAVSSTNQIKSIKCVRACARVCVYVCANYQSKTYLRLLFTPTPSLPLTIVIILDTPK